MNKIKFSNIEIRHFDIWFLEDTKDFNERKLLLGSTSKGKTVVTLIENRKIDFKVDCIELLNTKSGKKRKIPLSAKLKKVLL